MSNVRPHTYNRVMPLEIAAFAPDHYREARVLWERTPGVGLSEADEEPQILAYLARNPRSSFVAREGSTLVGPILCGHDGRRGLIHHLAVSTESRRQGVGRALLSAGLSALRAEGIHKCHLLVFGNNHDGLAFWSAVGAQLRNELQLLSLPTSAA